jgi:hypothetical protein
MSRKLSFGLAVTATGALVVAALLCLPPLSEPGSAPADAGAGATASSRPPGPARAPRSHAPAPDLRERPTPKPALDELAVAVAVDDVDETPLSFEEEIEHERDKVASDWSAFESEASDPRWAAATEQELETRLDAVAVLVEGLGGRRVECRTHRCMITLDWESRARTEQAMGSLIQQVLIPGCGRSLYLTPPPEPYRNDEPYQQVISIMCPPTDAPV